MTINGGYILIKLKINAHELKYVALLDKSVGINLFKFRTK